jgi:putative NADH-flavin reductase
MLTSAGFLDHGGERTGRYRVGGERVPGGEPSLSYADLAVAVVDGIERPVRHRTRVSVFNFRWRVWTTWDQSEERGRYRI